MSNKRFIALCCVFIITLYTNSLTGDFLFDDLFLVRDNSHLESFSQFLSYFTSDTGEFWRPVRLASFYLDTTLFGKSTIGYHISNIFYYTLFCILAYFFCQNLFNNRKLAIIVTLLFIAHPLHTEGVAYISGRKDILGGLFSFASLISFLRYTQQDSKKHLLLTILFFLLAIGAKEIYAILPLLFLAIEYYQKGTIRKHLLFYGVWFTGAVLFVLFIILIRNRVFFDYLHVIPVYGNNQGVNFPTAVKIGGYIFFLSFFPFPLSADYTFNAIKRINLLDPSFFISGGVLMLCALGAYYFRRKQKEVAFGLVWMLICLLPVSQIVPYSEIISERSLIFLSFGACLLAGVALMNLPKPYTVGVLVVILVLFSVTTIRRNQDWHDELSLWGATVKQHSDCARARYNLGIALARHKQFQAAEKEFRASLAINPPELVTVPDYSYDALVNLGNVYVCLGDFSRAKKMYQGVLKYDRDNRLALKNLRIINRLE
ncbi:MAG: tetratricopeptide repeat protein [Pseudomonadota bacterium]